MESNTSFTQALLQLLTSLEDNKKADRVAPTHILLTEVHSAVNNALNQLYKEGKIQVGSTLNSKYIIVKGK